MRAARIKYNNAKSQAKAAAAAKKNEIVNA